MVRENKIGRRVKELRRENPSLKLSVARRIAEAEEKTRAASAASVSSFKVAVGIAGPIGAWDPRGSWAAHARDVVLTVPLGLERDGEHVTGAVVEVAIGEPGRGGDGNGVLQGAAGSGKSFLMRELVLAAAAKYSPERISFALMNFAEGATFRGLEVLPHVVVSTTPDAAAAHDEVARVREFLESEIVRRQQLLGDWGVSTASEYRDRRTKDLDRTGGQTIMPALPDLLLIADDFAWYLSSFPENILELFETVGSAGCAAGVYMLLSSQSIEERMLKGVPDHIGFGISFKAFRAEDSRSVIGSEDALMLRRDGSAIIRKSSAGRGGERTRFRVFDLDASTEVAGGAEHGGGEALGEAVLQRFEVLSASR